MKARALIAALTLAAIPMTSAALAYAAGEPLGPPLPEAAAAPVAPAPASTGTPLAVRPSQPTQALSLAHEAQMGWGTKAILVLGIGGVAFLVWKRKKDQSTSSQVKRTLTIAARTSVGVRSELLLVDVDGQTLLLGVTPNSISRLSILGETPIAISELESDTRGLGDGDAEPGFVLPAGGASAPLARILERTSERNTPAKAAPMTRREETAPSVAPVSPMPMPTPKRARVRREPQLEGQVRGLAIRSQG